MRDEWVEVLPMDDLQALMLVLRDSENKDTSLEESLLEVEVETENNSDTETDSVQEATKATKPSTNKKATNIITWDDDVHPELLSVYLQETDEQIIKIAALLHKISKGEADKEEQEHAARIAHTIKGASGVVGITEIVDLTHKLEYILDYAVNNKIPKETAELLAESSDCLESLFEAVQEKAVVPEEYQPVLSKLSAYADTIENNETVTAESVELEMPELPDFINSTDKNSDSNEDIDASVNETIEITQKAIDASNATPTTKGKQDSSLEASVSNPTGTHIRVPTELINKLLNLAGELVTASSQVSDKVEKTITTSVQIKEQDKRVHKMLDELSSTILKQEKDQLTMLSSMQNKDFDTLEMDTYNELHSVAGLLTESILDSETIESTLKQQLNEIHDDLRILDNLNKELSDTILDSRMESLNSLVPRLERIIRQTCRKTQKEAELVVTGNDINIDTDIITGLVDPLLHLLRNAVDHGIETSKARKSKKKKLVGQIQLNFSRQGNFIHMQLKDDGAGIDPEKIYQHAIKKGLITPDQEFSKSEVLKLILEPGFTTQKKVTDISGRGVGMDVVNKGIEALNGSLSIDSKLGKGTIFNVKIPLTLVTSSTLLVSVSGNQVAIPTDSIEQLYYLSPEDVLNRKGKQYIRHQGKELAIESLASILGWAANDVDFTKAQTLLLIKGSQQLHAVYIDQIIHSREVVIKSLAHFISGSNGVIGACHLSDGAVAPVMNLPQLLSLNEKSSYIVKQLDKTKVEASPTNIVPQILVVDDCLSNRKALSLIIDKTEYDVITAVDGLDALSVMNEKHIDLVFTDLEMPRMTGLELTQAIRAWDEKKETPIVMVTSRSTNKHRELAKKAGVDDYLTKPVGTDTLLESIETWLKQDAIA
jgi:chemosensory pili system protein ChpA (sensor histidine kinase/response regulator)